MELAEVVCPQVALPVVGVLVCAVLVFAFGFKSPGQPPSFDFDDKKKIRRAKQKTSRSHTGNGHVPVTTDEVPNKSPSGGKSPRSVSSSSSPAASSKNTSPGSNKASPSVKQDAKKGLKKGSASKAAVEETKASVKPVEDVDDEGWMTQMSKKGKKQRGKKDEPEVLDKKLTKEEALEASAVEAKEVEATPAPTESGSPPLEKRKKKSRKTSKGAPEEGSSTGGSGEPTPAPVEEQSMEKVAPAGKIVPEPEPQPEPMPETTSETPAEQAAEALEEEAPLKPQKKSKTKKKEIGEDFEIPDVYTKSPLVEPVALPVIKPAKSPKKSKKDKKREQQTIVDIVDEALDLEVHSDPVTASAVSELSEAMQDIPAVPEVSPMESPTKPDPSSNAQTTENVTFDELGDSWIEAKVKTKKKKARREN